MHALRDFWFFLSDPDNQQTLTWIGGGLSAAFGALWIAITFYAPRKSTEPASEAPRAGVATVDANMTAVRNLHIGRDVRIEQGKLPRGALIVLCLGLAVLLYAVFTSRGDVSVIGGSYVGGDVEKSRIDVRPALASPP